MCNGKYSPAARPELVDISLNTTTGPAENYLRTKVMGGTSLILDNLSLKTDISK
jgi:hypothetical protein